MARLTWNAAVRKVIYTIHGDAGAIRLEDDDVEITERGKVVERRSIASHWGDASHKEWFGAILDRFARRHRQPASTSAPTRATPSCASS